MKFSRIKSGLYSCKYKGFSIEAEKGLTGWSCKVSINDRVHQMQTVATKKESIALVTVFCDDTNCFLLLDVSKDFKT